MDKEVWEKIAHAAIPQMEDLTGTHITWEDGAGGVVQMMLLVVISEIMPNPQCFDLTVLDMSRQIGTDHHTDPQFVHPVQKKRR